MYRWIRTDIAKVDPGACSLDDCFSSFLEVAGSKSIVRLVLTKSSRVIPLCISNFYWSAKVQFNVTPTFWYPSSASSSSPFHWNPGFFITTWYNNPNSWGILLHLVYHEFTGYQVHPGIHVVDFNWRATIPMELYYFPFIHWLIDIDLLTTLFVIYLLTYLLIFLFIIYLHIYLHVFICLITMLFVWCSYLVKLYKHWTLTCV